MRLSFGVRLALAAAFFVVPAGVSAQIEITEVAWMGTAASANDEWIELHNDGSESVSLSGWTLSAADGTPSITLSGSIGAGEYRLLERTDDTTFPGISALVIFTGALGNEGESLSLKNGGTTVQTFSFAGGWPAGDVTTKKTMQWTGSAWITADETAGSVTTAAADDTDDDDTADDDTTDDTVDETTDDEDEDTGDETVVTQTSSGAKRTVTRKRYDEMIFEIDFPNRVVAGDPAEFHAQALDFDRTKLHKGEYLFNMGDGTTRTSSPDWHKTGSGFTHTYEHPGTYHITIDYYLTRFEGGAPDVSDTFTIDVVAANVVISRVLSDGGIEMKNSSSSAVDMSGWKLTDASGASFTIPDGSAILAGSTIVFTQRVTRLSPLAGVMLSTENGSLVATSVQPKKVSSSTKSASVAKVAGEVLGVETEKAPTSEVGVPTPEGVGRSSAMIWILLFVILILVAVIAMLLLKKEERDGQYVLVEE